MADRTGLEPATSTVTGQRSNQLSYRSIMIFCCPSTMLGAPLDSLRTRVWLRPPMGRNHDRVLTFVKTSRVVSERGIAPLTLGL
jgi:hypothetical protein